jgi:hypothetical protein
MFFFFCKGVNEMLKSGKPIGSKSLILSLEKTEKLKIGYGKNWIAFSLMR